MSYTKRQKNNREIMKTLKEGDYVILCRGEWTSYYIEKPQKMTEENMFTTWTYGKVTKIHRQKRKDKYFITNMKIEYYCQPRDANIDYLNHYYTHFYNNGDADFFSYNSPKFEFLILADKPQVQIKREQKDIKDKINNKIKSELEIKARKKQIKLFKQNIQMYNEYHLYINMLTQNRDVSEIPQAFFDNINSITKAYKDALKTISPNQEHKDIPIKVNPPTFTYK